MESLIASKSSPDGTQHSKHSTRGCASQTPRKAHSRVGAHSSKLWSYTRNWASRGWALFCEWALFHETMVILYFTDLLVSLLPLYILAVPGLWYSVKPLLILAVRLQLKLSNCGMCWVFGHLATLFTHISDSCNILDWNSESCWGWHSKTVEATLRDFTSQHETVC